MTEKNDQKTDSMTEEEEESLLESEEQENQLDAKAPDSGLGQLDCRLYYGAWFRRFACHSA